MANKFRGMVPIQLAGREYVLRFTFNALAEIESELGRSIQELFQDAAKFGVTQVLAVTAAALRHQDHTMTAVKVGKLLDDSDLGLTGITEKIGEALNLVLNKAEDDDQEEEVPLSKPIPLPGTGS